MTALPLHDFTDAERAKLDAIEAAPDAEESVRERVARAMWEAQHEPSCSCSGWDALSRDLGDDFEDGARFRRLADAALAVLSGPSSDAVLPMCWDLSPGIHVAGVMFKQARCEVAYGHGGAHQASEGHPDFPMRWIHGNPDTEAAPC